MFIWNNAYSPFKHVNNAYNPIKHVKNAYHPFKHVSNAYHPFKHVNNAYNPFISMLITLTVPLNMVISLPFKHFNLSFAWFYIKHEKMKILSFFKKQLLFYFQIKNWKMLEILNNRFLSRFLLLILFLSMNWLKSS